MNNKFLLFLRGFDKKIPIVYVTSFPVADPVPKIIDAKTTLYIFIPIIDNTGIANNVEDPIDRGREFNRKDSKNRYNI